MSKAQQERDARRNFSLSGMDWEQTRAAQQGLAYQTPVDLSKPSKKPATESDYQALKTLGVEGLKAEGKFGILDRLNLL